MKVKEKEQARKFRLKGWSVRAIAKHAGCSKSSISTWVRDIELTTEQIKKLKSNQDRARAKAANHPNSPKNKWKRIREDIINKSSNEVRKDCSEEMLKYAGACLYWAEGYKASRSLFIFSNSDPVMIKLMIRFLKEIYKIHPDKLRGTVNIHPHLDIDGAQKYWSKISGIPLKQFHKPMLAVSRASKQKRKTLPLGTFRIVVSDVILCSKIKGWIKGIEIWANGSAG